MIRDVLLKLGVYGDGGVGKTSLVNAFFGKEVPNDYSPTFNSKISKKDYSLEKTGVVFKINIWDVGGNRNINPNINPAFFTDVDLALLIFDLTQPEKTLKTHKKNFLDKLIKYSEEPLTLIVGNKLDKLSLNARFKRAIIDFLGENARFSIISAKSNVNVKNCIELLIYTYLKKAEILTPDIVPENSTSEFMAKIGKNENELRNQLVNLSTIESKFREIKSTVKFVDEPKKGDKKEKYQEFIQNELKKISLQKKTVLDKFLKIIIDLEKNINQIKKQNIKTGVKLVENLLPSLENSRKDSEQNLDRLLKLNREENELMIISTKSRAVEIEAKFKAEESDLRVKKIKAKPIPKTKISPTKVKEIKVKTAPKVKVAPTKVEEVKVKTAPKVKATPAKVEEVKVKATPKVEATPAKVEEVKVKAASKVEVTPVKVEEVKEEASPKVKAASAEVEEVKVKATPKVKATLAKVEEVKVKATPKVKAAPAKVETKVKAMQKLKAIPTRVEKVKAKTAPKLKVSLVKVDKAKVKATPKIKATPPRFKKVKIGSTPIKKDPKIELYNRFERENPGKRAVYRGRETKGFLAWKDQINK